MIGPPSPRDPLFKLRLSYKRRGGEAELSLTLPVSVLLVLGLGAFAAVDLERVAGLLRVVGSLILSK